MTRFRFHGQVTTISETPGSAISWIGALPFVVIAKTKQQAADKVADLMGPSPRSTRWHCRFDKVEELDND